MNQLDFQKLNQCVFQRFRRNYEPPSEELLEGRIEEYVKALGGFEEDVLNEAMDLIVKRHRYLRWPSIPECLEAIDDAYATRAGNRARARTTGESVWSCADPLDEAAKRVNRFMNNPGFGPDGRWAERTWQWHPEFEKLDLVKLAEGEGWGHELRSYVRTRARAEVLAGRELKDPARFMPTCPLADDPWALKHDQRSWVDHARVEANRYREAAQHREDHPDLYRRHRAKSGTFKPMGQALNNAAKADGNVSV